LLIGESSHRLPSITNFAFKFLWIGECLSDVLLHNAVGVLIRMIANATIPGSVMPNNYCRKMSS